MRTMLLGALGALTLALAPTAQAETITIVDTLGREVEAPAHAERILLGFYYEDFYAVAGARAYDRVVAISRETWKEWRSLQWQAYVTHDPRIAELADIGGVEAGTFSLEAAIAAAPDLAILAAWQYKAIGAAAARLEAAGIPVVVIDYNAQTVAKHVASTRILGRLMGAQERAAELADGYAAAVADVERRVGEALVEAGAVRPRVYVELGRKGPGETDNSYAGTMWGAVIEQAGGRNIAAGQIAKWGPLSPEYVLSENPEAIFLAGSGWEGRDASVLMGPGVDPAVTQARLRAYLGRPGWDRLDAVRDGRVFGIYHGGARTLYDYAFLQFVGKALHPSAFADVDPQATLDLFFQTYMPIPFSGTYMTGLK